MRQAGRRILVLGAIALSAVIAAVGCTSPFEPISKTDKIEGLSFVDFSLTWDRWDTDPEYDGVVITPDYANEYGDSLAFHDKPHRITIEFYRQILDPDDTSVPPEIGDLFFTRSVTYENSDDDIRVPIEAYRSVLESEGYDLDEEVKIFVICRFFPPQGFPRAEMPVGYPDQSIFKPEISDVTPNP